VAVGSFRRAVLNFARRAAAAQQQLSQASVDERSLEDVERNYPDVKPGGLVNKELA
jgi:hypothetical protein